MQIVVLLRRITCASLPWLLVALFFLSSSGAMAHEHAVSPQAVAVAFSDAPCASPVSNNRLNDVRCVPADDRAMHHGRTGCCGGMMVGCCLVALAVFSPALVFDRGGVLAVLLVSPLWPSTVLESNFRPPIIS